MLKGSDEESARQESGGKGEKKNIINILKRFNRHCNIIILFLNIYPLAFVVCIVYNNVFVCTVLYELTKFVKSICKQ